MSLKSFLPFIPRVVIAREVPAPNQQPDAWADWGADFLDEFYCKVLQADFQSYIPNPTNLPSLIVNYSISDKEITSGSSGPDIYAIEMNPSQAGLKAIVTANCHYWQLNVGAADPNPMQCAALYRGRCINGQNAPGYWGDQINTDNGKEFHNLIWVSVWDGNPEAVGNPGIILPPFVGGLLPAYLGNEVAALAQIAAMRKAAGV